MTQHIQSEWYTGDGRFPLTRPQIMIAAVSIFLTTYELEVGHYYLHPKYFFFL